MNKNDSKIWIWIQNGKLLKAKCNFSNGSLTICNEDDEILIKQKGLTQSQIQKIEIVFSKTGAKRIDRRKEPFTYM